jgi:hypothetical protein
LECGGAPPLFRRHRERRSKQKKATAKMDRKFQEVRRNIFAALLISEGCSNRFNEPREASWSAVALYRFSKDHEQHAVTLLHSTFSDDPAAVAGSHRDLI